MQAGALKEPHFERPRWMARSRPRAAAWTRTCTPPWRRTSIGDPISFVMSGYQAERWGKWRPRGALQHPRGHQDGRAQGHGPGPLRLRQRQGQLRPLDERLWRQGPGDDAWHRPRRRQGQHLLRLWAGSRALSRSLAGTPARKSRQVVSKGREPSSLGPPAGPPFSPRSGRLSRPRVRYPGPSTSDGSGAIVHVETAISEAATAFPITPTTNMGAGYQEKVANGALRTSGARRCGFCRVGESEHSAAAACEGFAMAGGRVTISPPARA